MMRSIITAAFLTALPAAAFAAPVNLTSWIENGLGGNNGAGTWTVQSGDDSVLQSSNGQPTVFFDPGANDQGQELQGTINVLGSGDDDYVGFVLGYQDGEMDSTNADFWLIDWKQRDQGAASVGLSLSHVTGDLTGSPANDFWAHIGTVNEVQRATNLGSTGWVDPQEYTFSLTFTSSLIEVKVDGVTELSWSQADNGGVAFTDGAFGFYNYSQNNVLYAGITQDVVVDPSAVPLPAGLPLMLAGLGAFGWMRRRQKT